MHWYVLALVAASRFSIYVWGSSSCKGFGGGRGKGLRKGPPIVWEGPIGPEIYPEPVCEFPVQRKSEFTTTKPLRGYDNRKEDLAKMHAS